MITYSIKPDDEGHYILTVEPYTYCGEQMEGRTLEFNFQYLAERCGNSFKRDWILGTYNNLVQTIKMSVNADCYYPTRQKADRLTRLEKLNAYIQDPHKTLNQICKWIIQFESEITGAFPNEKSHYFNQLQTIHSSIKQFVEAEYQEPKKNESTEQKQLWQS